MTIKSTGNLAEIKNIQVDRDGREKLFEDEFLSSGNLVTVNRDVVARRVKRVLTDLEELIKESKWEDAVALYYPVDEKLPDIVEYGQDLGVREKIAFVLGHLRRFDDAIAQLQLCIQAEPERFHTRSALAYTAYDSLYCLKSREIIMNAKDKALRIQLAHENFQKAQEFRPDGVTNYYREGMLYRQIEGKTDRSQPLFKKAVDNWEALSADDREVRHQEKKNYIKALYQLAGCCMEADDPGNALQAIRKCLAEDEQANHLLMVHKYFALGKINFFAGNFPAARDALMFAAQCGRSGKQGIDYVHELLARTYLAMGYPDRAMETINQEPEHRRRPYYRWTEADVHCSLGDMDRACDVLVKSMQRDNRSKHKSLIKLARIEYLRGNFDKAGTYCESADRFFREKWDNHCLDALFWGALAAFRGNNREKALDLAQTLHSCAPYYPRLSALREKIGVTKQ